MQPWGGFLEEVALEQTPERSIGSLQDLGKGFQPEETVVQRHKGGKIARSFPGIPGSRVGSAQVSRSLGRGGWEAGGGPAVWRRDCPAGRGGPTGESKKLVA